RHATELVELIRAEHGDRFRIEVAAYPETHPQAEDALADLRHFKAKIDAGADAALTQYFYNADAYFRFVEDARRLGVEVPIIPGILPIANFTQLRRFSEACGAEIPRWIGRRMQAFGDDAASVREFAADVVASLCQRLVDGGAPGLHFYTLNLARPTEAVLRRLGCAHRRFPCTRAAARLGRCAASLLRCPAWACSWSWPPRPCRRRPRPCSAAWMHRAARFSPTAAAPTWARPSGCPPRSRPVPTAAGAACCRAAARAPPRNWPGSSAPP